MTVGPDPALELPRSVRDELVAHARSGAPEEVCGVLAGDLDGRTSTVSAAHRATNVAVPPESRYEIDPEEGYATFREIEDSGLDVVGFYHSHPTGPPGPSETDAAQATWPERSYVIVVLGGAEPLVGSWRWTGEEFRKETVRIVD